MVLGNMAEHKLSRRDEDETGAGSGREQGPGPRLRPAAQEAAHDLTCRAGLLGVAVWHAQGLVLHSPLKGSQQAVREPNR